jgi:hypothetical protein
MKKPKQLKRPSLTGRIEREVTSPSWTPFQHGEQPLDPATQEHLAHFLASINEMPPLEHTSLLTPESAREAVQKLDAVHSEIQQKIRTAQALRKLLENQRK